MTPERFNDTRPSSSSTSVTTPGTPPTKKTPGTPPTKETPGTPPTKETPGTPPTKETPGTPPTEETPGTPTTSETPGTPPTKETPGTPPTKETPGTPPTKETPGTPPTKETPGTPPTKETPGTPPTKETPGTPPTKETPGTPPTKETPGTPPTKETPGTPPTKETPGTPPTKETPGTPPTEETPGTPTTSETPGTPPTKETPGTPPTRETPGTPPTKETPGTPPTTETPGTPPTKETPGTPPTKETPGTPPTKETPGTPPTIETPGTPPTEETPGTPTTSETPGTPPTKETPGTPPTKETPGTPPTKETPGTPPTQETPGTPPTKETPGTPPTKETPGTPPTKETPGTPPTKETPGTPPTRETPGTPPTEETPGTPTTSETPGTPPTTSISSTQSTTMTPERFNDTRPSSSSTSVTTPGTPPTKETPGTPPTKETPGTPPTKETPGTPPTKETPGTPTTFITSGTTEPVEYCIYKGVIVPENEVVEVGVCDYVICIDNQIRNAVDCSAWSSWSDCSKSCDTGFKRRTRDCKFIDEAKPLTQIHLPNCMNKEVEICNVCPCEEDCEVSEWSSWSDCESVCPPASSESRRTRHIIKPSAYGGLPCPALTETKLCPQKPDCNCTGDFEFTSCSNACPYKCEHLSASRTSTSAACVMDNCVPGCACKLPKLLQDGKCVEKRECRCPFTMFTNPTLPPVTEITTTIADGATNGPTTSEVTPIPATLQPNSYYIHGCNNCTCEEGVVDCTSTSCSTESTPTCEEWSNWSDCSTDCGKGVRMRMRMCPDKEIQKADCVGTKCNCLVTMAAIREAIGINDNTFETAVWVEMDGQSGLTSAIEQVFEGQQIEEHTEFYITCGHGKCEDGQLKILRNDSCDCEWENWSRWTSCTATCGSGTRSRTRTIKHPASYGGRSCSQKASETEICDLGPCPCVWSQWGVWSQCSSPCGGGVMRRKREPMNDECEDGIDTEVKHCNVQICPNDKCNGEKIMRYCHNITCPYLCEHLHRGVQCHEAHTCVDGCFCKEGFVENKDGQCVKKEECKCKAPTNCGECMEGKCIDGKPVCVNTTNCDCRWDEWTKWSKCSSLCGPGTRIRTRAYAQHKRGNGKSCSGSDTDEMENCFGTECPQCEYENVIYNAGDTMPSDNKCLECYCDHNSERTCKPKDNANPSKPKPTWSEWGRWSSCSATCGSGTRSRPRTCLDPCHRDGGPRNCSGESIESENCNTNPCRVDCELGPWERVSQCDAVCEADDYSGMAIGILTEMRSIITPASGGGKECPLEDRKRELPCTKKCKRDCIVISWTDSPCMKTCSPKDKDCDPTCGTGYKMLRPKQFIPELNGGKPCSDIVKIIPCDLGKCVNIGCKPPQEKKQCVNRCKTKCKALSMADVCEEPTGCVEGCACPDGKMEQDGQCVDVSSCRCTWDARKLGPKPAQLSEELEAGYVVPRHCNQCVCKNGNWKCTELNCKLDCVWGEWEKDGDCSASCGKGEQKWIRKVKQPARYGGEECQGPSTKTTECIADQICCEENVVIRDGCERTCAQVVGAVTSISSDQCKEGCKCIEGYARDSNGKCIKEEFCKQCRDGDAIWQHGKYVAQYKDKCAFKYCENSKFIEKPMDIEDLDPCSSEDQIKANQGETKARHPTRCCYITILKPCRPIKTLLWRVNLPNGGECELTKPVTVTQCHGACVSSSGLTENVFLSESQADELYSNDLTKLSQDPNKMLIPFKKECRCCAPKQLRARPPIKASCKYTGQIVFIRGTEILSCGCTDICRK